MTTIRRSHAKSKTGCVTCKARRVKCDEYWPTCNNCFRGGRTCEYTSTTRPRLARSRTSMAGDSALIPRWLEETCSPQTLTPQEWHHVPRPALRCIVYMCVEKARLDDRGASPFCCWWNVFEIFIQLASDPAFDFVAYAMIVIAANRISSLTRSRSILEKAALYEPRAIQGLRQALASFSRDNANAVLAASILLLYQQKNWNGWRTIMKGSASVVEQMRPWLKDSPFFSSLRYDEDSCALDTDTNASSRSRPAEPEDPAIAKDKSIDTPQENQAKPSFSPSPRLLEVHLQTLSQAETYLLSQATTSLSFLATCTRQHNPEGSATLRALRDLIQVAQSPPPGTRGGQWAESEQYRLLYPFAPFSKPLSKSFDTVSAHDPFLLATFAHVYAVTVTLALSTFKALNTATFVPTMAIGIGNIGVAFAKFPVTIDCPGCGTTHRSEELITFPLNALRFYQQQLRQGDRERE